MLNNYRESIIIKDHIKCNHIIAGDFSYYSGYYHGGSFEDCVLYLDETDNKSNATEIDRLIIGKFCSIASGVKFMMGGNQGHNYNWIATYPLDSFDDNFDKNKPNPPKAYELKGDTIIGNDVWIGAEAMIMPGCKISDGAVIAARAIVTKDIGPYEIWGGNPARLIKKRFSDDDIEKLLEIKWWDWELPILKKNISLLQTNDIATLYEHAQNNNL